MQWHWSAVFLHGVQTKVTITIEEAFCELDFLFDGEMTGRVIGKRGANISKLRGPADQNSPLYVTVNKESHEFDGSRLKMRNC